MIDTQHLIGLNDLYQIQFESYLYLFLSFKICFLFTLILYSFIGLIAAIAIAVLFVIVIDTHKCLISSALKSIRPRDGKRDLRIHFVRKLLNKTKQGIASLYLNEFRLAFVTQIINDIDDERAGIDTRFEDDQTLCLFVVTTLRCVTICRWQRHAIFVVQGVYATRGDVVRSVGNHQTLLCVLTSLVVQEKSVFLSRRHLSS